MASTLHQSALCGRAVAANKLVCLRSLPTRRVPQAVASPQPITADRPSETNRTPAPSTSGYNASYTSSQQVGPSEDLQSVADWLRLELTRNFREGEVSSASYSPSFRFSDPIYQSTGLESHRQNLRLLRTVFNIDFTLHSVTTVPEKEQIITRWTFSARIKALPLGQKLIFTGTSTYNVSLGLLVSQKDVWDAVGNNDFLSLEGMGHVLRMALNPATTPNLYTPQYQVLQKRGDYEVRRYQSFLVAEVSMRLGSGPASGSGFNDLAGYIFGGNDRRESMEMTTPVVTTAGQTGPGSNRMAFVMESKYDLASLPVPRDSRIERRQVEAGKTFAAWSFSGVPLDYEVVEAERRLRGALLVDRLKAMPGYQLCRWNDPFTLPFVRRNEVLIELEGFSLDM